MCKLELVLFGSNPREVIFMDLGIRLPLKGDYWTHAGQNDFCSDAILSMNEVHEHSFPAHYFDMPSYLQTLVMSSSHGLFRYNVPPHPAVLEASDPL